MIRLDKAKPGSLQHGISNAMRCGHGRRALACEIARVDTAYRILAMERLSRVCAQMTGRFSLPGTGEKSVKGCVEPAHL